MRPETYAIFGISKCAALEVAEMGIHINCIGPGPIDTPMMTKLEKQALGDNVSKEEAMKIFAASYPTKRYSRPKEVADLALFLASDKSIDVLPRINPWDSHLDSPDST